MCSLLCPCGHVYILFTQVFSVSLITSVSPRASTIITSYQASPPLSPLYVEPTYLLSEFSTFHEVSKEISLNVRAQQCFPFCPVTSDISMCFVCSSGFPPPSPRMYSRDFEEEFIAFR